MSERKAKGEALDPLVPIDQGVLQALLAERRWSVASLARRTGELEQTLAHALNSHGARCRKSRRARIAKAFQVPQELLSGERFPVPMGFMLPDGFEFRYSKRTQLAASRFISRVLKTFRRDLRLCQETPPVDTPPHEFLESSIVSVFTEFMMVGEWRKRFVEWNPEEQMRRGYTEPATVRPWDGDILMSAKEGMGHHLWEASAPRRSRDPDHEDAILSLIRAMEHLLAPWFTGRAKLNYRALRDFVHLPNHPFALAKERIPATSPFAILAPAVLRSQNKGREKRSKRTS